MLPDLEVHDHWPCHVMPRPREGIYCLVGTGLDSWWVSQECFPHFRGIGNTMTLLVCFVI